MSTIETPPQDRLPVETVVSQFDERLIRDAIRRMQTEESRAAAWQAAIAKGDAQLDRGEGAPYTPELMERMTQSAIATMHNGQPIDPDVLP